LKQTLGESAGTQDFKSVELADVILVIGANPSDGHPVFASRMKKRLRQGARLIVIDPRKIELVKSPHIQADYHLKLRPGTNVAAITAMAHVIVNEGLLAEKFIAERCEKNPLLTGVSLWRGRQFPEATERNRRARTELRAAAACMPLAAMRRLLWPGVTEHSRAPPW
jgi:formate dehydrogenase major subunit